MWLTLSRLMRLLSLPAAFSLMLSNPSLATQPDWVTTGESEDILEPRNTRFNTYQLNELFKRGRPKVYAEFGPTQEVIPYENLDEARKDLIITPSVIGRRNLATREVFLYNSLPFILNPRRTLKDLTPELLPQDHRDFILNYAQVYTEEPPLKTELMMPKLVRLAFSSKPEDLYASFLLLRYEPQLQEWRGNFYKGGSLVHFNSLGFRDIEDEFTRDGNRCPFKNFAFEGGRRSNPGSSNYSVSPESLGLWYFRAGTLFLYTSSFQQDSHDFLNLADKWFQRSLQENCPLGACGAMLLNLISLTSQDNAAAAYYLSRLDWDANLPEDPGLTSSTARWCDDFASIADHLGYQEPLDYDKPQGSCWRPQSLSSEFVGDFVDFVGTAYPEIHQRPLHINPQHLQELHQRYLHYVQGYSPLDPYQEVAVGGMTHSMPLGIYSNQLLGREHHLAWACSGRTPEELQDWDESNPGKYDNCIRTAAKRISSHVLRYMAHYPYQDLRKRPFGAFYNFFFHPTVKILPSSQQQLLDNFKAYGTVSANPGNWTSWDHPTPEFSFKNSRSRRVLKEICPVAHGNQTLATFFSEVGISQDIKKQAAEAHRLALQKRQNQLESSSAIHLTSCHASLANHWRFHTPEECRESQKKSPYPSDKGYPLLWQLLSDPPYGLHYPPPTFPLPHLGPAAGLVTHRYKLIVPTREEVELCDWPPIDPNDSLACFSPFTSVHLTRKFVADTLRVWGVQIDHRYDAGPNASRLASKWDSRFVQSLRPLRQQAYLAGCALVSGMYINATPSTASQEDDPTFRKKKLQEHEATILKLAHEIDLLIKNFNRQNTYIVGKGETPDINRYFMAQLYPYCWNFIEKEQRLGWARFYRNLALGRQEAMAHFVRIGREKQKFYIEKFNLTPQDQSPWVIATYRTAKDITQKSRPDMMKTACWEIPLCIQDSYTKVMWKEEQQVFHGVPRNAPMLAIMNPAYFSENSHGEEVQILWFHPHHDHGKGRLLVRRSPYATRIPRPYAPPRGQTDFYPHWPSWQGRSLEEHLATTVPAELTSAQSESMINRFDRPSSLSDPASWDLKTYEGRLAFNRHIGSSLPSCGQELLEGCLFPEGSSFEEALSQQGRCLSLAGPSFEDIRVLAEANKALTWDVSGPLQKAQDLFVKHPEARNVCAISSESDFGGRPGQIVQLVAPPLPESDQEPKAKLKIITRLCSEPHEPTSTVRPADAARYPCRDLTLVCATGCTQPKLLASQRLKCGLWQEANNLAWDEEGDLETLVTLYTAYRTNNPQDLKEKPALEALPSQLKNALNKAAYRIYTHQSLDTGESFISTRWDHKSIWWTRLCCYEKLAHHHRHVAEQTLGRTLKLKHRLTNLVTEDELHLAQKTFQDASKTYATYHHHRLLAEALLKQRAQLIAQPYVQDVYIPPCISQEFTTPIPYTFFDPEKPSGLDSDTLFVASDVSSSPLKFGCLLTQHPTLAWVDQPRRCQTPDPFSSSPTPQRLTQVQKPQNSLDFSPTLFSNEAPIQLPLRNLKRLSLKEVVEQLYNDLTHLDSSEHSISLSEELNTFSPPLSTITHSESDREKSLSSARTSAPDATSSIGLTEVDLVLFHLPSYENLPKFLTLEHLLYLNIEEGDRLEEDHKQDIVLFNTVLHDYHQIFLQDHPGTTLEREKAIEHYRVEANRSLRRQGKRLLTPEERRCFLAETLAFTHKKTVLSLENDSPKEDAHFHQLPWENRRIPQVNVSYDPRISGRYPSISLPQLFSGLEAWVASHQDRLTLARQRLENFQFEALERQRVHQHRISRFLSTPSLESCLRSPFTAPCSTPLPEDPCSESLTSHEALNLGISSQDNDSLLASPCFIMPRFSISSENHSPEKLNSEEESFSYTDLHGNNLLESKNLQASQANLIPAYFLTDAPEQAEILPEFLVQNLLSHPQIALNTPQESAALMRILGRLMLLASRNLDPSPTTYIPELKLEHMITLSQALSESLQRFQQETREGPLESSLHLSKKAHQFDPKDEIDGPSYTQASAP